MVTTTVPADDPLAGELRVVLRAGLPVQAERCGPALLGLRGVRGRSQRPEEPGSRAQALDRLLREQLDRLENVELAVPAHLLFGLAPSTSGASLTARRQAASAAARYEVHHFRKRVEPKLLALLAWQLRRDSADFAIRHASPPELHAASRPLILPADVFLWEVAEHQHAIAALWGAVYLLRAELLTVARLSSMDAAGTEVFAAANMALWRHAQVLRAVTAYRAAYGTVLLGSPSELGPQDVASYAGWTPTLTPAQELLLAEAANPDHGLSDFTARLEAAGDGTELATTWRRALTGCTPSGVGPY